MKTGLFLFLLAGAAVAAPPPSLLREESDDVRLLAVERVRQFPNDAPRVLKEAEDRLRASHESFRVAGGTPTVTLESEARSLNARINAVRLARSRGRALKADPAVEERVNALWRLHEDEFALLLESFHAARQAGGSESALYWDAVKAHEALSAAAVRALLYNTPPGEPALEALFARERARLLRAVEPPEKVRGRSVCVTVPEEHPRPAPSDPSPFYRALGLIPQESPVDRGAFRVPPGCRTALARAGQVRRVFRAAAGRGSVGLGGRDIPLRYAYVEVPPDHPFLVQNEGKEPLDVDYVDLLP